MIKYDLVETFEEALDGAPGLVKILDEPYKDVTFRYLTVKFLESEEADECTLEFKFELIDNEHLQDDQNFRKFIGDLLIQMLEERFGDSSIDE